MLDNSLTGADVNDNSLTGADVNDNSLTGADVNDNSLTGADVNESTLGKVPSAVNADSVNGKSAADLEGARASAIVAGDNCAVGGFARSFATGVWRTPSTPLRASTAWGLTAFPPTTQRALPSSRPYFPSLMSGGIGVRRFMGATRLALHRSMRST